MKAGSLHATSSFETSKSITLRRSLLFVITSMFVISVHAQSTEPDPWLMHEKLPSWASKIIKSQKLDSLYVVSDFINPFYLEADLDGDNKNDIAIAMQKKAGKQKGFVIIHQSSGKYFMIGAGKEFGNGGDNFDWMDI